MYARFSLLALLALALTVPALAQTRYTWNGGAGDWDEPTNWSPEGVPAVTDTAIVSGGTGTVVTLTGTTTVAGFELSNAAIDGDFDLKVAREGVWFTSTAGNTLTGEGALIISSDATFRMTGTGGSAHFNMTADRELVNDGFLEWDAGEWRGASRLVNNGELLLSVPESDAFGFVFSGRSDAIRNNAGGLIRRNGSGDALAVSGFVNDGTISVESGTLTFQGFNGTGLTGAGTIDVTGGSPVRFTGGINTQGSITGRNLLVNSNSQLTVSGIYDIERTFVFGGATLNLNGTSTTEELELSGTGTALGGGGTLTVTRDLEWSGGIMGGTGTTVLAPRVTYSLSGAGVTLRDARTLRTEGETIWLDDIDISNTTFSPDVTFENAGFLISSGEGERVFQSGTLRNTGIISHNGGTLRFEHRLDNEGEIHIQEGDVRMETNASSASTAGGTDTGRYIVEEGGRLLFSKGDRLLTETAEIVGTGEVGIAPNSATAQLTNRATWRPGASPGVLTITSDWPQSNGVLEIELGGYAPGTEFDQLVVTGEATLGGTLRIVLTDDFVPRVGDRFLIMPAASVVFGFDTVELPEGIDADIEVTAQGAELVIVAVTDSEADGPGVALPETFALHAAYPNPFTHNATLHYDVPTASRVRLALYDLLGREVALLADAERAPGRYEAVLPATNLAAGLYLVRMTADGFAETRRLTLAR